MLLLGLCIHWLLYWLSPVEDAHQLVGRAEILMRPVVQASTECMHLAAARDAVTALLEACLNKQPAFKTDRLIAIFRSPIEEHSGAGTA